MTTKEIKVKIHEEADLYSEYDPEQMLLSEEITGYVERNYINKHRSKADQFILHIYSEKPVNEERVRTRLREYFSGEKDNVSYAIKKITFKQICLVIFGAVMLAVWLFMSENPDRVSAVMLEILSIIGTVAVWEAASIAVMERPELVLLKKSYERIINARIVFDLVPEQD